VILPGIGGVLVKGTQFPSRRGSVQVSTQSSGTSFAPTIPTHQADDVILVFVAYSVSGPPFGPANISGSAGWTEVAEAQNSGGTRGIALYSRLATGSSHTITITNNNNSDINAHVYVLQYASGTVLASTADGNDPPNRTTTWGSDLTLWFAAMTNTGSAGPATVPTGFTDGVQDTAPTFTTVNKQDSSSSLDPSAFESKSGALTMTVAVKPA
jgi:hypothetical protein